MPLIHSKSKKAFKKNVETEMKSNPDKKDRAQNLAIAYSVQKKNKKMAKGGKIKFSKDHQENQHLYVGDEGTSKQGGQVRSANRSKSWAADEGPVGSSSPSIERSMAKDQMGKARDTAKKRLETTKAMPAPKIQGLYDGGLVDENDDNSIRRNSGNKASKDDSWTDNSTVKQAQKPSLTKLSQPRIVGSDAFSVRNRDMRDDENDLGDKIYPETDKAQPIQRDNEDGPRRQGPKVSDMERQHKAKRAAYNVEIEHDDSMDESEDDMRKKQSPPGRYAEGGKVDGAKTGGRVQMQPKDNHDELEERDDESDMESHLEPGAHGEQPAHWRDELDADMQNPDALDMEDEHSTGRKPYARGGDVDDDDSPHMPDPDMEDEERPDKGWGKVIFKAEGGSIEDEEMEEHYSSIAAAIMAKKDRESAMNSGSADEDAAERYAEGGSIESKDSIDSDDSSQADLSRNADEDANEEDQLSYNALRKENYNESEGLSKLDSPRDSNEHGHELSDEDAHSMVDSIRRKMAMRRQFSK